MELIDQFRYLVGGYYGVSLVDEYPLKEYILKDIENYIRDFIEVNPIDDFDYKKEALEVKDTVSEKVKLQDALLVLNRINGPMDLVFMIKNKLKKYLKSLAQCLAHSQHSETHGFIFSFSMILSMESVVSMDPLSNSPSFIS